MNFTILTQPLSWKEKLIYQFKKYIKYVLGKNTYWPNSVIQSIIWWLSDIQDEGETNGYNINPEERGVYPIVFVPNGIETLRYALNLKKQWKIKHLIAWPNISVPKDKNDICFHPEIDTIIAPSRWTENYFLSLNPWETRIQIWASWVDDRGQSNKKECSILIYKKNCPEELFEYITRFLTIRNMPYTLIGYGDFKKEDYLEELNSCQAMIYLQESESQWLALHEAWMADIPTLIWNRWYWEYQVMEWKDEKISAPYLTAECGLFFQGLDEFDAKFAEFTSQLTNYSPRKYSLEHFTNEIATRKLLHIIQTTWTK